MKITDKIMLIDFATVRELLKQDGWESARITELYYLLLDSSVKLEDLRTRRKKN